MLRIASLLLAIWWILSDGSIAGLGFGLIAVALALFAARLIPPPMRARGTGLTVLRWRAVPRFLAYFLSRSLIAGVDVARRTLTPRMPLSPRVLVLRTELPAGPAQVFLMATLSLLPGTLGMSVQQDTITLHVLDDRDDAERDMRTAEGYVGPMFAAVQA